VERLKSERKELLHKLEELKHEGYDYLVKITAVDYEKSVQAIYFIRDMKANKDQTVEVDLEYKDAWLPTAMDIYPAADWYERELMEMFGIEIKGRIAKRLLLEKWDGIDPPFRKSFQWNTEYRTK
jgi:NADH-quinone oxidoreductase subunit C